MPTNARPPARTAAAAVVAPLPSDPPPSVISQPKAPAPDRPAAPDMSGIPGLTMSRALLYLPGRDAIFVRVLRQFCDQHGDGLPALRAALREGDLPAARRQLHALRGACGAVGATAVLTEALALEQQLLAREQQGAAATADDGDACAERVLQTLADLVQAVRARLAQADGAAGPASPAVTPVALSDADRSRLQAELGQLITQLRQADFRAGACFLALEPALRTALGHVPVQRLATPLARHDYEAALHAAEGLLHTLAQPTQPA